MTALDTRRAFFTTPRRGSALITVTLVSAVILLLVGSILSYALSERRLNTRHIARIEARNAAEALAEYGAAQIRQKYETRGTFTLNPNGTDALQQPPSSFWSGTNIISTTSSLGGTTAPPTASLDLELIGGTQRQISTGTSNLYFVDPADENNAKDPLIGKWVARRDVSVIARASVRPPMGAPITAYVGQTISVRGAPLFAHAIFYNMDLEIFNGPEMNISGPVHTNGNLYVYPETGALTFKGNVTATGKIFHAPKPGDSVNVNGGNRTAAVNFLNRAGQSVNLKGRDVTTTSTTEFWRDSTGGNGTSGTSFANFAANASQVWNGYLQTGEHGIQNYTPAAIGKYVEDPTPASGGDNSVNTGRLIIEPPAIPLASDANYALKMEVEKQKYSNLAGIYITVDPSTGTIQAESRGLAGDNTLKSAKTITLPTNGNLVKFHPYEEEKTDITYSTENGKRYKTTLKTTIKVGSSTPGTPEKVQVSSTAANSTTYTVKKGMYDQHRAKGQNLIDVDIGALKEAVAEMQKSSGVNAQKALGNFSTDDWNGIVYVNVLGGPTTRVVDASSSLPAGSTVDATNTASLQTSVRLINGATQVPSYGSANPGLTIATNAPVYVKGNYNTTVANGGAPDTSGGKDPSTDYETNEVPAAIIADAITVISSGFDDASSRGSSNPTASSNHIVVSAAMLQGIAPSNKNGNGRTSGGAHNIVRFLENWSGKDTWFRGSLVCLFESRVFTEPHGTSNYYQPPDRNWGFNKLFGQGLYPPGTPRVLSYRRVGFTDLSAAEYATLRDSFNWW